MSNVYYTAVPLIHTPLCNPYKGNLTQLCRVRDQNTNSLGIDINWFFAPGNVSQNSGVDCPSVEGEMGVMIVNDSRHTLTKHWDPDERSLSVTLKIADLSSSDVGRYWCQAVLPSSGQKFNRTSSFCLAHNDLYSIDWPCFKLFKPSLACASLLPMPTVLHSPSSFTVSPTSSDTAVLPSSTPDLAISPLTETLIPSTSGHLSSSLISSSSHAPSTSSTYRNNIVISSFIASITSSAARMMSSHDYPHQESTVLPTSSSPPSTHVSLNGDPATTMIVSVVFCAVSAIALLITATIAVGVVRWYRRMQHWRAEWHINEGMDSCFLVQLEMNTIMS